MQSSLFRWRPEYRIRATREFKHIQRTGRKYRTAHLLGVVAQKDGPARFGFTVSKKVGNAVVRNRLKRLLREICRHEYSNVRPGTQIILIVHPNAALVSFNTLQSNVRSILNKLSA